MCIIIENVKIKKAVSGIYLWEKRDMEKQKRRAHEILKLFIPVALFALATTTRCLYTADSLICDKVYSRFEGLQPDIRIIGVDEETLGEYGSFEQWSREKSAELIEILYADEKKAPKLMAFDFLFVSSGDESKDARLAEMCEDKNIVFASNLVYRGTTKEASDNGIYYDIWNVDMVEQPYQALNQNVHSGYANNFMADDGIVRYTKLTEQVKSGTQTSFAWTVYDMAQQLDGKKSIMPKTDQNGCVNFFYSGRIGEYPHFSMKDVLDKTVPASVFKDSIVFVGAYAPGMQDAYAVAAERGNHMYGVEIHANIVQALRENKTAVPVGNLFYIPVAAIIIALFFAFAQKQKLGIVVTEGVILCLLHLAAGRLLSKQGYTITQVYFQGIVILGMIYFVVEKYLIEKIKRRRLLSSFKTYVAPQVVEQLAKDETFKSRLGGEKRDVAVLFVDIRGFTPLSEGLLPEQVVSILNEYLKLTTTSILRNQGMLDKFIGDATMAVFNAPLDLDDYVFRAVKAAIDMRKGADELAKGLQEKYGKTVSFGIGVNCGPAVIGNIGCSFRMDYTAIGDTVNTASRLESRARPNEILVSSAVYEQIKDRVMAEQVGEMELKGKSNKVMTYRILDIMEVSHE